MTDMQKDRNGRTPASRRTASPNTNSEVLMKKLAATALAAFAATALLLSLATPAQASAFGCAYIGGFGFEFEGVALKAPKGYLCHTIRGSGRTITNQSAGYFANPSGYGALTGRVCGWRIDFVYRSNANGNPQYLRDKGTTNNGCGYTASRNVPADKRLPHYGTSCAELYVNGVLRSTQCHNITT